MSKQQAWNQFFSKGKPYRRLLFIRLYFLYDACTLNAHTIKTDDEDEYRDTKLVREDGKEWNIKDMRNRFDTHKDYKGWSK